jgi:hypothetical protein
MKKLARKVSVVMAAVVCAAFLAPPAAWARPAVASAGSFPGLERPGCVGDSFSGTLESTKAICSDFYLVRMQPNGDLVLREIASGNACWASGTRAPGDASATFHVDKFELDAWITIDSVSQGEVGKIDGSTPTFLGTDELNASVNNEGEFWVGFTRVASC